MAVKANPPRLRPLENPIFLITVVFILLLSPALIYGEEKMRREHLIKDVPFFKQDEYQCGPASLAGVLGYWGFFIEPAKIAAEIFSSSARGVLGIDLALYARKKNLSADFYRGSQDDLRNRINDDCPLILFVDIGFWVLEKGHFIVVTGYNKSGFFINSGNEQMKFISNEDLNSIWRKTNFWTLAIRP